MKPFWVIQTDRDAHSDLAELARSLREHKVPFVGCELTPFGDEIRYLFEPPPADHVIIPYGSTKLTALARQLEWTGLFYDPETFRADVWAKNRDDMLNQNPEILTVADVERRFTNHHDEAECFFIRPVEDLKAFTGCIGSAWELAHFSTSHLAGSAFGSCIHYAKEFTLDTLCAVSPALELAGEWRFFVVDGRVVSGSQYMRGRNRVRNAINDWMDPTLRAARQMVKNWLPHKVCVMDIALLAGDGPPQYRVIEFNTFNSSGFYADDIFMIATHVSDFVSRMEG